MFRHYCADGNTVQLEQWVQYHTAICPSDQRSDLQTHLSSSSLSLSSSSSSSSSPTKDNQTKQTLMMVRKKEIEYLSDELDVYQPKQKRRRICLPFSSSSSSSSSSSPLLSTTTTTTTTSVLDDTKKTEYCGGLYCLNKQTFSWESVAKLAQSQCVPVLEAGHPEIVEWFLKTKLVSGTTQVHGTTSLMCLLVSYTEYVDLVKQYVSSSSSIGEMFEHACMYGNLVMVKTLLGLDSTLGFSSPILEALSCMMWQQQLDKIACVDEKLIKKQDGTFDFLLSVLDSNGLNVQDIAITFPVVLRKCILINTFNFFKSFLRFMQTYYDHRWEHWDLPSTLDETYNVESEAIDFQKKHSKRLSWQKGWNGTLVNLAMFLVTGQPSDRSDMLRLLVGKNDTEGGVVVRKNWLSWVLHYKHCHKNHIRILVEQGADPSIGLESAVRNCNYVSMIKFLLADLKANVHYHDDTALKLAVWNVFYEPDSSRFWLDRVICLLEHGANFHAISQKQQYDIITMLLQENMSYISTVADVLEECECEWDYENVNNNNNEPNKYLVKKEKMIIKDDGGNQEPMIQSHHHVSPIVILRKILWLQLKVTLCEHEASETL